jgi:transcription elongation GreA/GreB family factor
VTVHCQSKNVALITAKAPLGNAMLGKQIGDEINLDIAGKQIWYEIIHII